MSADFLRFGPHGPNVNFRAINTCQVIDLDFLRDSFPLLGKFGETYWETPLNFPESLQHNGGHGYGGYLWWLHHWLASIVAAKIFGNTNIYPQCSRIDILRPITAGEYVAYLIVRRKTKSIASIEVLLFNGDKNQYATKLSATFTSLPEGYRNLSMSFRDLISGIRKRPVLPSLELADMTPVAPNSEGSCAGRFLARPLSWIPGQPYAGPTSDLLIALDGLGGRPAILPAFFHQVVTEPRQIRCPTQWIEATFSHPVESPELMRRILSEPIEVQWKGALFNQKISAEAFRIHPHCPGYLTVELPTSNGGRPWNLMSVTFNQVWQLNA